MTSHDALAFLHTLTNYERAPNVEAMRQVPLLRMRRLCHHLGNPQQRFRSVLVTGTNGKGSICAMLYAMLRAGQIRVGLYTSPHLSDVRERIRVSDAHSEWAHGGDGEDWITPMECATLGEQLQPAVAAVAQEFPASPPTYFEVLTALAFLHFAKQGVAVAVLEVGMGGRLDATNVVEQAVSVLGPIDVDHADVLGHDPVTIAREKAGIIKPGQVVISAPQHEEVAALLDATCTAQGATLLRVGRALTVQSTRQDLEGLTLSVVSRRGRYDALTLPLLGRHQACNAAVAVGALEALSPIGVPHTLVARGLAQVVWPGRLEVVHTHPLVLLDGAHNAQAAACLAEALAELCPDRQRHLVIGMSSDKSVEAFGQRLGLSDAPPRPSGQRLGPSCASVTCTKSAHPRALDPYELARRLAPCCAAVSIIPDVTDAVTVLLNTVSPHDVIVVTGSVFLVGELRSALGAVDARDAPVSVSTPTGG